MALDFSSIQKGEDVKLDHILFSYDDDFYSEDFDKFPKDFKSLEEYVDKFEKAKKLQDEGKKFYFKITFIGFEKIFECKEEEDFEKCLEEKNKKSLLPLLIQIIENTDPNIRKEYDCKILSETPVLINCEKEAYQSFPLDLRNTGKNSLDKDCIWIWIREKSEISMSDSTIQKTANTDEVTTCKFMATGLDKKEAGVYNVFFELYAPNRKKSLGINLQFPVEIVKEN